MLRYNQRLIGNSPFVADTKREILSLNKSNSIVRTNLKSAPIRHEFKSLIAKMMKTNPSKRPSAQEILEHPLLQKYREETHILINSMTLGAPVKNEKSPTTKLSGVLPTAPSSNTDYNISRKTSLKSPKNDDLEEEKMRTPYFDAPKDISFDPKKTSENFLDANVEINQTIKSTELKEDEIETEKIGFWRLNTLVSNKPLVKPNIKMLRLMKGIQTVEEKFCESSVAESDDLGNSDNKSINENMDICDEVIEEIGGVLSKYTNKTKESRFFII